MESVYSFNGSAIGLGGVLSSGGVKTVIPSLASVALAPTGGEGSSVCENYNNHGISFTRAESRVFGTEIGDGIYTTYTDVYVTNLNIFDRLKIALMSATISSTHNLKLNESSFDVRTSYRGVAVDDEEVVPEYDLALCSAPTYDDVVRAVKEDLRGYTKRWKTNAKLLETSLSSANPIHALGGSVVKDLKASDKIAKHANHSIVVPGVGRAHFGEFLFKPGRRRVNLLRLSVGKFALDPIDIDPKPLSQSRRRVAPQRMVLMDLNDGTGGVGGITVGSVEGNGTPPTG
ncbi:MAG TPA: hypothetical protein VKB93_26270 [Thermoanaerobaculia bacterium]|nr:hypothetical protein [Thermoanaerobaculia bacterium]